MKRKTLCCIIGLVIAMFSFSELIAQKYIIDPGHTSVQTEVVRFGVVPVVGRFNEVSGEIYCDLKNLEDTKANLTIATDSYNANNEAGEKAIKSEAFLDVAKYPNIKFRLTSLKKSTEGYIATGELEIHGTQQAVEMPVNIIGPSIDLPTRKQSIGITGDLSIDRTTYGVGKNMKLPNGSVIISNDVQISFVLLAIAE